MCWFKLVDDLIRLIFFYFEGLMINFEFMLGFIGGLFLFICMMIIIVVCVVIKVKLLFGKYIILV